VEHRRVSKESPRLAGKLSDRLEPTRDLHMNLVLLTQYYPPEIGAPQTRLSELAAHFVQRGHSVTVLTAMPNYPTGKISPGYGGVWQREQRDGGDGSQQVHGRLIML